MTDECSAYAGTDSGATVLGDDYVHLQSLRLVRQRRSKFAKERCKVRRVRPERVLCFVGGMDSSVCAAICGSGYEFMRCILAMDSDGGSGSAGGAGGCAADRSEGVYASQIDIFRRIGGPR